MTYVLHRSIGSKVVLNQIRSATLRIGRGTNSDLRSEDATVALEHAAIEHNDEGYVLIDRGSITGTYLNGKPIESVRLSPGDVIEVGSLRLRVQVADPRQPMFLKVENIGAEGKPAEIGAEAATSAPSAAPVEVALGRGSVVAPTVDYVRAYQLRGSILTKATVVAVVLAAATAGILAVVHKRDETVFRPGALSSAHTTIAIATNCAACHEAWQGVSDQKCIACHANPEHNDMQANAPACTGCHTEHREFSRLQLVADSTCVSCHSNLRVKEGESQFARSIDRFGGTHPEFALAVWTDEGPQRVRMNEPAAQQSDRAILKFNHQFHLSKPQPDGSGGEVQLTCNDCHQPVESNGQAEPQSLSFEEHCQSCHALTFDRRFPDTEVPHGGDPSLLYSFLANVYSANRDVMTRSPQEARRLLSRSAKTPPSAGQQALVSTEQVLKTRCAKCHQIDRTEGRLAVTVPQFRHQWFPHARFRHQPHLGIECQRCHNAEESRETSDALMPRIAQCQECHGRVGVVTAGIALASSSEVASSSCITCHVYHQRSKDGPWHTAGRAMPVQTTPGPGAVFPASPWFLVGAIVVSLFLLAVYLERRRQRQQRMGVREAGPAPASPPSAPKPSAGKTPPPTPSASGSPEPTVAVPLTRRTQLVDLSAPTPGGTEMIQWFGTIRWTSGPMMGQKLPLTGEGFWIGRDGDLSQLVINDSRISRKHVWVGPRQGKIVARDEGSTNGTFLNSSTSERITEVELKRGDQVILGEGVASFEYIP